MYSIGELGRKFKLSRSTLIYYDMIGLLPASKRTQSNYRQYSEEDQSRLSQICTLRKAGLPLSQILNILNADVNMECNVLERRLNELNQEIIYLRFQQKLIVEMLKDKNQTEKNMLMDRDTFTNLIKSAGFSDIALKRFHKQFEKASSDSHQFFLEFLGFQGEEIDRIREFSRNNNH